MVSKGQVLGCIQVDEAKAPGTAENFLAYVRDGYYDNTIFHRVIDGFMIQGGGFDPEFERKPTRATTGPGVWMTRATTRRPPPAGPMLWNGRPTIFR